MFSYFKTQISAIVVSLILIACNSHSDKIDNKKPIQESITVDANFQWNELKNVFQQHYQKKYPNQIVEINAILEQQSLIEIKYYGFDNKVYKGQLICNQMVEKELIAIFNELFALKFPLKSIKPISEFQFEDALSMQANNTTCFDYRLKIMGNGMSKHATGMAIDINPMQNPYLHKSKVEPFPNLSDNSMGRIRNTDETEKIVIEIFKKYGWNWGGNWRSAKDYMHFEK